MGEDRRLACCVWRPAGRFPGRTEGVFGGPPKTTRQRHGLPGPSCRRRILASFRVWRATSPKPASISDFQPHFSENRPRFSESDILLPKSSPIFPLLMSSFGKSGRILQFRPPPGHSDVQLPFSLPPEFQRLRQPTPASMCVSTPPRRMAGTVWPCSHLLPRADRGSVTRRTIEYNRAFRQNRRVLRCGHCCGSQSRGPVAARGSVTRSSFACSRVARLVRPAPCCQTRRGSQSRVPEQCANAPSVSSLPIIP